MPSRRVAARRERPEMDGVSAQLIYIVMGYLSGSVLYSELFMRLFRGESLAQVSANHNPGSSNAFIYGGFWVGAPSVACDILKGLVPVALFCRRFSLASPWLALVMAAPVLGHARSCFFGWQGGMCIATSFGVLLGLLPCGSPVVALAALYLGLLLVPGIDNGVRSIIAFVTLPILGIAAACVGKLGAPAEVGLVLISLVARKKIWPDLACEDRTRFAHLRLPGDAR